MKSLHINSGTAGHDGPSILWLHDMGDPRYRRRAVIQLENCLRGVTGLGNIIVHDARLDVSGHVLDQIDAVFLGPTFLCNRYTEARRQDIEERFQWLADHPATKIALPQDDFDCSVHLETWLVDWGVETVFTAFPEKWSLLYPRLAASGLLPERSFTGFVDRALLGRRDSWPATFERPVDVSYRASTLPPNFGSLGVLKSGIAKSFSDAVRTAEPSLILDISCDPHDVIAGDRWLGFLTDSKFCLATPAGSSLWDPLGEFRASVESFLLTHPEADFTEVEANCFPGLDNAHVFTTLSPRNLEAALCGTVQIAVEGAYSGILTADIDYIPVEPECSDISRVLAAVADERYTNLLRENAYESVVAEPLLRIENWISRLLAFIGEEPHRPSAISSASHKWNGNLQAMHDREAEAYWQRVIFGSRSRRLVRALGGAQVKRYLTQRGLTRGS